MMMKHLILAAALAAFASAAHAGDQGSPDKDCGSDGNTR